MQNEETKLEPGVSFLNFKRKLLAMEKDIRNTIEYMEKLEQNLEIHKSKAQTRRTNSERSLKAFLSQDVGEDVIRNELALNYWEKETGLDREELIRLKKAELYRRD